MDSLKRVQELMSVAKNLTEQLEALYVELAPKDAYTFEPVTEPFPAPKICCSFKYLNEQPSKRIRCENNRGFFELEKVKAYFNSSHKDFVLFRCKQCGALLFYEFDEHMSFSGGHDDINCTYVAVESAEEADGYYEEIKKGKSHIRHIPKLQVHDDGDYYRLVEVK